MSTGFSAADFEIVPNNDQLPMPIRDAEGFTRYSATIMLPSRLQYDTLAAYQSQIDSQPALGGGGLIVVVAGTGKRTLTYPAQGGDEETAQAILLSLSAKVRMLSSGHIVADADWLLVI